MARNDAQPRKAFSLVETVAELVPFLQEPVDMEKVYSVVDSVLREHPLYAVVGVRGGCLEDLFLLSDKRQAEKKRDSMLKDYGLTQKDKPDNQHVKSCRWNSENEVHLHEMRHLE